ncbi:MAG: glycosyl transferase [Rhodospirillales bacterium]|nr:glycosyl transferase [Rhodospirillales bacterium]
MKLLHVCEPLAAGVGRHVTSLAHGLAERGHELHVLYSPLRADPALVEEFETQGTVVARPVPMTRSPSMSDAGSLATIVNYLREQGPFDIIHAHSSKAGALARMVAPMSTAGVVYTPHAFATMATNEFSPRMLGVYRRIERTLARVTNRVICLGIAEFDHARTVIGIPEDRLVIVPNCLTTDDFRFDSDLRSELGLPRNAKLIGFVGRLEPQKGPDIAIRAMATISAAEPDAYLIMIGEGSERARLLELAESCDVAAMVRWLGWRAAREYYHNFEVLLSPSRYDSFAMTPMEALYCGVPVVCTRVGTAHEVVRHGFNGFLVELEDVDGFAAATLEILQRPGMQGTMSTNARDASDYLSPDEMLAEIEQVYFGRRVGPGPYAPVAEPIAVRTG